MLYSFLTVGKIIVHYLGLLVYPIRLNADYSCNAYHKKVDFDKAISAYKKALNINPIAADAHYNLGLTCEKKVCWTKPSLSIRKQL